MRYVVKVKTVGATWTMDGKHTGIGPWLGVIHECNRLSGEPRMFGSPMPGQDDDGNYRERYPDADVTFIGNTAQDQMVTITGKTDRGIRLIKQAADSMGLHWDDDAEEN